MESQGKDVVNFLTKKAILVLLTIHIDLWYLILTGSRINCASMQTSNIKPKSPRPKSCRCRRIHIFAHALIPLGLFILVGILDYIVYSRKEWAYFYCTPVMLLFLAMWGPATKSILDDNAKYASQTFFLGGAILWLPFLLLGSVGYFEGGHSIGPILLTSTSSFLMFLLGGFYRVRVYSDLSVDEYRNIQKSHQPKPKESTDN